MKLAALDHQGRRGEEIPIGKLSVEVLADEHKRQRGFSKSDIYQYVRLTKVVPRLLDLVDAGKMTIDTGEMLSYFSRVEQAQLLDMISKH